MTKQRVHESLTMDCETKVSLFIDDESIERDVENVPNKEHQHPASPFPTRLKDRLE